MQQFEGAAPANGVGGLRRDSQTIPCAQADLVPLQAQRHITLQHIIDRVAEVALLTDALSPSPKASSVIWQCSLRERAMLTTRPGWMEMSSLRAAGC